jgi:hypothetical protein
MEIARQRELEGQGSENAGSIYNGLLHRSEVTQEEHPLSLGKTTAWNQFFEVPTVAFGYGSFYICCCCCLFVHLQIIVTL